MADSCCSSHLWVASVHETPPGPEGCWDAQPPWQRRVLSGGWRYIWLHPPRQSNTADPAEFPTKEKTLYSPQLQTATRRLKVPLHRFYQTRNNIFNCKYGENDSLEMNVSVAASNDSQLHVSDPPQNLVKEFQKSNLIIICVGKKKTKNSSRVFMFDLPMLQSN